MQFKNPFEAPGNWRKANLHTHTTTSDGDSVLEDRIAQYRNEGYGILAITDHHKTNEISGFSSDDFLVISGMEIHPDCPGGGCYHFVSLNLPLDFEDPSDKEANTAIQMVKEAGGEVIIAHPYWCGQNVHDFTHLKDAVAVEVYNATCTKVGRGYSSVQWDDMLQRDMILPAVAVDDVHRGRDKFMGWTMFKTPELTIPAVMDALLNGCFYSSTGPEIKDLKIADGKMTIKCSPAVEVQFIGLPVRGQCFFADDGEPLTQAEITLNPEWKYVRVEIADAQGGRAWTNPVFI